MYHAPGVNGDTCMWRGRENFVSFSNAYSLSVSVWAIEQRQYQRQQVLITDWVIVVQMVGTSYLVFLLLFLCNFMFFYVLCMQSAVLWPQVDTVVHRFSNVHKQVQNDYQWGLITPKVARRWTTKPVPRYNLVRCVRDDLICFTVVYHHSVVPLVCDLSFVGVRWLTRKEKYHDGDVSCHQNHTMNQENENVVKLPTMIW